MKFKKEDAYTFDFFLMIVTIVLFIYNITLITLPRADKIRINGSMGIAINMDKILPEKLDLYIPTNDDVFRHYMYVFSKVHRVFSFDSYINSPTTEPFYFLTVSPDFCSGKVYEVCQRFPYPVERTDYFVYYIKNLQVK